MLLIGDIVKYGSHNKNAIKYSEIIGTEQQIDSIKNRMDLNKLNYKYGNYISETYASDDGKHITFHKANKFLPLYNILETTFSNNNNIKICNPVIQAVIDYSRLGFKYKNIEKWEEDIKFYSQISIKYLNHLPPSSLDKLGGLSKRLKGWSSFNYDEYISGSHYFYNYYLDPVSLYATYSDITNRRRGYFNLYTSKKTDLLSEYRLNHDVWKDYSHDEKVLSIVDFLKVRTMEDYIYKEYEREKRLPPNMKKYIYKTYMNLLSSDIYTDIVLFAKNNFLEIIFNIDIREYEVTTNNVLKYGFLRKE